MHTLASAWDELAQDRALDVPAPRPGDDLRSVCHDLRGHLAAIGMIASALRADPELPETADRRLGSLLDEVALTTEMVRRVVTGQRNVTVVAMDALVRQCADRAAATSRTEVRCETDAVSVVADRVQLTRLLGNLLDNATRAAGPSGRVEVHLQHRVDLHPTDRPGGAVAVLTVEDDGPGFGAGEPGLAGLGLELVQSVAVEAGGTLALGRSRLGGAVATLTLPLGGQ